MLATKTVLVLGAGASYPYGYPLGSGLREEILSLPRTVAGKKVLYEAGITSSKMMNEGPEAVLSFLDAFKKSQMYSIDAFLARRAEFSEIGKQCIAVVLLGKESEGRLLNQAEGHWYQYLLNKIVAERWQEVDFENLSIVTFNYDRSLERYLYVSLQAAFDQDEESVAEKLRKLKIVHVYGTLGSAFSVDSGYFSYSGAIDYKRVRSAAAGLRVIPEGRQDDQALIEARRVLSEADSIGFLGFGFDVTNLDRLNSQVTCASWVQRPTGHLLRKVVASCYGMTIAEAHQAANRIRHEVGRGNYPEGFINSDCLGTLRETLLLS